MPGNIGKHGTPGDRGAVGPKGEPTSMVFPGDPGDSGLPGDFSASGLHRALLNILVVAPQTFLDINCKIKNFRYSWSPWF